MDRTAKIRVGNRRKEEIIDAAAGIVSELGIQKLSLSEIEKRTGLCRGQLTYYYRTKEQILIDLYDRVIRLMHERAVIEAPDLANEQPDPAKAGQRLQQVLEMVLKPDHLVNQHIHALQHTFLSQISHREDLRGKLADLYRDWRLCIAKDVKSLTNSGKAEGIGSSRPEPDAIEPSAEEIATIYQALLHGLGMQIAADPDCVDRGRMAKICKALMLDLVSSSTGGMSESLPSSTTKG